MKLPDRSDMLARFTRNVRHVVIQTVALHNDIASLKLVALLRRVVSSDNCCSDHFTKLLPVIPFWTHTTSAMMGARYLVKCHLVHLGFDPAPRNHLASLIRPLIN
jgi:hypothetical protein